MSLCNFIKCWIADFYFFCLNIHAMKIILLLFCVGGGGEKVLWFVFIIINYTKCNNIKIEEKFAHNFTTSANQNVFISLTLKK